MSEKVCPGFKCKDGNNYLLDGCEGCDNHYADEGYDEYTVGCLEGYEIVQKWFQDPAEPKGRRLCRICHVAEDKLGETDIIMEYPISSLSGYVLDENGVCGHCKERRRLEELRRITISDA